MKLVTAIKVLIAKDKNRGMGAGRIMGLLGDMDLFPSDGTVKSSLSQMVKRGDMVTDSLWCAECCHSHKIYRLTDTARAKLAGDGLI